MVIAVGSMCGACVGQEGKGLVEAQTFRCEYLSPHFGLVKIWNSKTDHGGQILIRMKEDAPGYEIIAETKGALLSTEGELLGYMSGMKGNKRMVNVLNAEGATVRTIECEGYPILLGEAGHAEMPMFLEVMQMDLTFNDKRGAKVGQLKREGARIRNYAVAKDGSLAMIVRPAQAGAENRFLWVSPIGEVIQEFALKGCVDRERAAVPEWGEKLIVRNTEAAIVYYVGREPPVMGPHGMELRESMLCVVSRGKEPRTAVTPKDCGDTPVWFGEDGVGMVGVSQRLRIWDVGEGKWRGNAIDFSGQTHRECVEVDGVAVTLVFKEKPRPGYWIEAVDVKTNKMVGTLQLRYETPIVAARALYPTKKGVVVVTRNELYKVNVEEWKKAGGTGPYFN